jgi:hypothetical protein
MGAIKSIPGPDSMKREKGKDAIPSILFPYLSFLSLRDRKRACR